MATTAARLCELGMPPIVAREVIAQFAAGVGQATRFVEHGVPPPMARELATQAGGAKSAPKLIELGMPGDLAFEVVA